MSESIKGRVTSVKFFESRTDLVVFAVHTGTDTGTGQYNTKVVDVKLAGIPAIDQCDIVRFVTGSRYVSAVVTDPDYDNSGTGFTPCGSVSLFASDEQ